MMQTDESQPTATKCDRCGVAIQATTHSDNRGMCRPCRTRVPDRPTVENLLDSLDNLPPSVVSAMFGKFSKQQPTVEAIPVLRRAIQLVDNATAVNSAAISIRKLGSAATGLLPELFDAAYLIDRHRMPQSYPSCLEAIVAVDRMNEKTLPLITHFVGIHNWIPISTSMKALRTIGTDDALHLLKRIRDFWYCEFNKTQRRIADELLAASGPPN
jgi:hypothetical protein